MFSLFCVFVFYLIMMTVVVVMMVMQSQQLLLKVCVLMMSTLTANVSYRATQLAVICDIIHDRNPHVSYAASPSYTLSFVAPNIFCAGSFAAERLLFFSSFFVTEKIGLSRSFDRWRCYFANCIALPAQLFHASVPRFSSAAWLS